MSEYEAHRLMDFLLINSKACAKKEVLSFEAVYTS